MKLLHYLYIAPLAALLSACNSNEELSATDHPNGTIELKAGIVEGGGAVTRAGAEDSHNPITETGTSPGYGGHQTLTTGTQLALRVSGTWTGHSPSPVVKTTTATVGTETATDSKHNNVNFTPAETLYWDDYGTADPDNAATGRVEGLTIFGAAIDGKTTAPAVSDWTALSWTLAADQTSTDNTPADKDLLISNNVQPAPGAATSNDGTYKFDDYIAAPATYTKLLEFRHALSKITVNLKAGDGFTGNVFVTPPEVKLTGNEGTPVDASAWPFTTGTVNITTGLWSSQGTHAAITMSTAASLSATAPTGEGYTVTKEALVIPGSEFSADNATILRINADENIYYVTAEKIRAAITSKSLTTGTGASEKWLTLPGKNYVINVIVNKTEIKVTATVADWTTVTAETVEPEINITADWGTTPTETTILSKDEFSFYRRTSTETDYSLGMTENNYYKEIRRVIKSASTWNMSTYNSTTWETTPLYWPDHFTHYQFRGVWPTTVVTASGDTDHPRVEKGTKDYQYIQIQNTAYVSSTYPSDLMIGRPDVATDAVCTNNETGHTTTNLYSGGICATEGKVNLKFNYMMSQVEVNLSTSAVGSMDWVKLVGATVEIENIYAAGDVKLDDRSVVPTGNTSSYTLDTVTDDPATADVDESVTKRLSAIVPQALAYTTAHAAENARFKITITNDNGTNDVYYADIAPIMKTGTTDYIATYQASPSKKWQWDSGVHYVYNLHLTKTEVKVTATLTDWHKVEATEQVWF